MSRFRSVVTRATLCGLLGWMAPPASMAADLGFEDGHYYLGALGSFGKPDEDRAGSTANIEHSTGANFLFGWQSPQRWGYEILGLSENIETGKQFTTDLYRYSLNGDFTYALGDRKSLTPFALIGAGINYNDSAPGGDGADPFANVGLGVVTAPLTQRGQIRLRAEARYLYDDFRSGYQDFRFALGLEIPLVYPAEAPPPAAPRETVRVVDTVYVPTGAVDSDGDGVVDASDQCPGTPAGTRVDGKGCALDKIIVLQGVTFETNKSVLKGDSLTVLDGALAILQKYPDMKVEIAGHTDNVGSDALNQKLSAARAQAVVNYFVSKSVAASRLSAKGYGESQPIADNGTEQGRAINRRSELRVQD